MSKMLENRDMKKKPNLGDYVKVHLPGESPWAECIALHDDGSWEGRIDNKLLREMDDEKRAQYCGGIDCSPPDHRFRYNQIVRFVIVNVYDDVWLWMPDSGELEKYGGNRKRDWLHV